MLIDLGIHALGLDVQELQGPSTGPVISGLLDLGELDIRVDAVCCCWHCRHKPHLQVWPLAVTCMSQKVVRIYTCASFKIAGQTAVL